MKETRENGCRPLTVQEFDLVRWLLEHDKPGAKNFLAQLKLAKVAPWVRPCGCASIDFAIDGRGTPSGVMNVVADFVFGGEADLSEIFVYVQDGTLAGLEVYGLAGDAPTILPAPESLRSFDSEATLGTPSPSPLRATTGYWSSPGASSPLSFHTDRSS